MSTQPSAEAEGYGAGQTGPVLFVAGSPRSGTTLVSRMLQLYYGYGMGPEGHWILEYVKRTKSFGDLENDDNARRLIASILREEMFQIVRENYPPVNGHKVDVTVEMVWGLLSDRTYPGVVLAVLAALTRELGKSNVGNKNPGFARDLGTLYSLFPDAKYLFVMRDGRDVALSMMKQPWGQQSWYANARFWADTCAAYERFKTQVRKDQLLLIRYEDLLTDPDETASRLDAFLDNQLSAEGRAELVSQILGGKRRENFEKWRNRMTPRDHRLYEAAAGEWLGRFGYERMTDAPRAYPWESAIFMGLEYGRRVWARIRNAVGLPAEGPPTPRDRPGGL